MKDLSWILLALIIGVLGQTVSRGYSLMEQLSDLDVSVLGLMAIEAGFTVFIIVATVVLGVIASKDRRNNDQKGNEYQVRWLLCPQCGKGSVQNDDAKLPSHTFSDVDGLPVDIASLYGEARASFSAQAYTGCEMLCRKILMSVAVDKGAKERKTFADYVDYLDNRGYVTPPLKKMADSIRENWNKAAHEIVPLDLRRAKGTLTFTRRILDTVYGVEREIDEIDEYGDADQTGSSGSPP